MATRLMSWIRSRTTPEQRRLVKFLVVGGSGVPVNLLSVLVATAALPVWRFAGIRNWLAGVFSFPELTNDGVRDIVVYLIGIVVSIFTNFLLHNYWTWGDRVKSNPGGGFVPRLAKFYLVSSVAASVQLIVSSLLSPQMRKVDLFTLQIWGDYQVYHVLAPSAGILAGLAINYFVNNIWTFRKKAE
ncbi:GtrA family protein [Myxococcota bacterium]|nr:GtrA family protein [Myxococcota bacterium]